MGILCVHANNDFVSNHQSLARLTKTLFTAGFRSIPKRAEPKIISGISKKKSILEFSSSK